MTITPGQDSIIPDAGLKLKRRDVLASALALGSMPLAAKAKAMLVNPARQEDDVLDTLVVGSGVAGCYAAWRLSSADPSSRIGVFERSDRIGGRLWSVQPSGHAEQVAELGGMRIASTQLPLVNLVDEFGLTTTSYPATLDEDIYYMRGDRCRASELMASPRYGYKVRKDLVGKSMVDLFNIVLKTVTGKTDWTREEIDSTYRTVTYKGINLHDLPRMWVFQDVLGHSAATMLIDAIGYGFPNNNAGVFIAEVILDLFIKEYGHVDGGYQRIPLTMADMARSNGVDFAFKHEMCDLEQEGDLSVVTFRTPDGQRRRIKARNVILTIPMSAYDKLPDTCALRDQNTLRTLSDNLLRVPATKIYVNFPHQWWKQLGIGYGRSITDLPLRQCFYLADSSGRGLTLSPYVSGFEESGFWSPLLLRDRNHMGGDSMAARTIVQQLRQMHGVDVPDATEIHYRVFDGGYEGFGWNMWQPGARPWLLAPAARRPIPGRRVFCTGQATAQVQGWVMDTISSIESVLRSEFRLQRPAWWPASYPAT